MNDTQQPEQRARGRIHRLLRDAGHEEILASRRAKMEAGEATFVTLEELKGAAPR